MTSRYGARPSAVICVSAARTVPTPTTTPPRPGSRATATTSWPVVAAGTVSGRAGPGPGLGSADALITVPPVSPSSPTSAGAPSGPPTVATVRVWAITPVA